MKLVIIATVTASVLALSGCMHDTQRPWIGFQPVGVRIGEPFKVNSDGKTANVTLQYYLANSGNDAARVFIFGEVAGNFLKEADMEVELNAMCNRGLEAFKSGRHPLTILPGSSTSYGVAYETGDSASNRERMAPADFHHESNPDGTDFVNIGCIIYQSTTGTLHQTPFRAYLNSTNLPLGPWISGKAD